MVIRRTVQTQALPWEPTGVSQSRNSKASNRSFARKKQDDNGVQGYFNGSYSEISVAQPPIGPHRLFWSAG